MLYLLLKPRPLLGMAKRETWKTPGYSFLARLWGGIPVDRSGKDMSGLRRAQNHLAAGGLIIMAPEGTRTGNGVLREARAGAITLAAISGAPLLPLAHHGGELFWHNFKRFRKTPFNIRVGEPLKLDYREEKGSAQLRNQALRELMVSLARLLPEKLRGFYQAETESYQDRPFEYLFPLPSDGDAP